jgi:predicted MFS family arabinose efflux permease
VLGNYLGGRIPFLVSGMALLLAAFILFILVPCQKLPSVHLNLLGRLGQAAKFPLTWWMAGTNILARIAWGVVVAFFPAFLILNFGMNTAEVALPMVMIALGATAGSLLGGRVCSNAKRLIVTAGLLFAAAVPGLAIFLLDLEPWVFVFMSGLFLLLIAPVTTGLMIVIAEIGGTARGSLTGVISCSNYAGTAVGAAIGGVVLSQYGFGALSCLLISAISGSELLMAFAVNDKAVGSAQEYFSKSQDDINASSHAVTTSPSPR